jgi:thiol:disulfide interchange protein DsbD
MGLLSALIVGPCVAAPLAGALIYIGQTGDAVLGGMALFSLSLGMGAPLLLIGIGAGKLLPRAGVWMDKVKAVFGVLMLAVAIWLLERILPAPVILALWAALLVLSAIYLGAVDSLPVEASGWTRLWKGVGVLSLVYGVLLLIGAASGARDPLRPLQGIAAGQSGVAYSATEEHLPFQRVKTTGDLDRALAAAQERGQPVMVDFYADWCVSCKEMEKYTFARPEVQRALSEVLLLQADVTANDEADKALLKRFNLIGPPSIIFYDESGAERPELRLVGFKPADAFVEHIGRL